MEQIIRLTETEISNRKNKIAQLEHEKAEALRDASCSQNKIDSESVELEKLEYSLSQLLKKFPGSYTGIERGVSPLANMKTAGRPDVSFDELQSLINALAKKGGRASIKQILSNYNYDSVGAIEENDYSRIYDDLKKLS